MKNWIDKESHVPPTKGYVERTVSHNYFRKIQDTEYHVEKAFEGVQKLDKQIYVNQRLSHIVHSNQLSKLYSYKEMSSEIREKLEVQVSNETIDKAIRFIKYLKSENIVADWVSATKDNSIVFEITTRVKRYVIEFNDSPDIGFSSLDKTGGIATDSINSIEEIAARIKKIYIDYPGDFTG